VIGPGAVVEDGSILSGGNRVERGHVGAYTYVGPETDLIDAAIHQNELFNFKHHAHVQNLESFVARGLNADHKARAAKPTLKDRWIALTLYLSWTKYGYSSDGAFKDLKGIQRPALCDHSIHARRPWLKEVALGRFELFGVTPRPTTAVERIPQDWRAILEDAPPGAFSYADVLGIHEIGSGEETLHSVYQTGINHERCRQLFDNWLQNLN
jgi:hypothetical protein